jgi:ribosomal protein L37AE/L43A
VAAPADSTLVACSLCERPLLVRPEATAGVWLCGDCGSHPVLVAAFREGRARLAEAD